MQEIKFCRNCENWHTTSQWQGNCIKHPWENDKWSQGTTTGGCTDYYDKYEKYRIAQKEKHESIKH